MPERTLPAKISWFISDFVCSDACIRTNTAVVGDVERPTDARGLQNLERSAALSTCHDRAQLQLISLSQPRRSATTVLIIHVSNFRKRANCTCQRWWPAKTLAVRCESKFRDVSLTALPLKR